MNLRELEQRIKDTAALQNTVQRPVKVLMSIQEADDLLRKIRALVEAATAVGGILDLNDEDLAGEDYASAADAIEMLCVGTIAIDAAIDDLAPR